MKLQAHFVMGARVFVLVLTQAPKRDTNLEIEKNLVLKKTEVDR